MSSFNSTSPYNERGFGLRGLSPTVRMVLMVVAAIITAMIVWTVAGAILQFLVGVVAWLLKVALTVAAIYFVVRLIRRS